LRRFRRLRRLREFRRFRGLRWFRGLMFLMNDEDVVLPKRRVLLKLPNPVDVSYERRGRRSS